MEHLVPLRRESWSFFERQRQVFSDIFKGMDKDMDTEWKEFDMELERMRSEMFTLKALDFNDFGSSMIKPEHPIVSDEQGNKRLSLR